MLTNLIIRYSGDLCPIDVDSIDDAEDLGTCLTLKVFRLTFDTCFLNIIQKVFSSSKELLLKCNVFLRTEGCPSCL